MPPTPVYTPRMAGSGTLPDFIVIGAMKAATTTLFQYLSEHPGAFMPELKEPDFFVAEKTWPKGFAWYASLFAAAPDGALLGEGSTNYSKAGSFPGVPERIRQHVPDVKLIYLLRDPVERIRSHYVHRLLSGTERRPPAEAIVAGSSYVDTSLYGNQLGRFLDHFPAEQVLVVLTENLRDDPATLLARMQVFLGLDRYDYPDLGRRDHDTSLRRADGGLATKIRRNDRLMLWARQSIPRSVRARLRGRLTRNVDTSRIHIPDQVIADLRGLLHEDRELLQRLRPLDLSKWAPTDLSTAPEN